MKQLITGTIIFILGLIFGYFYFYSHTTMVGLNYTHTSWYEEKIKSYIPMNLTKHKQRNHRLISKFQG